MRYVLLLLVALVLLGTGSVVWFAWHGSIAPIAPSVRTAFDPAAIASGARLAALGDCMSCHTIPGGTAFSGGRAVQTPFGAIYASMAGWKLLFFRSATFRPDSAQSAEWNRGAYLAQGLAHCGACHTPRNILGAEKSGRALDGGYAQGWDAYALASASPALEPWTADAIYAYLRHGWQARHGVALGPMGEVTHDLGTAPDADVRAIAIYVASLIGAQRLRPAPPPAAPSNGDGEALYRGACASCHEGSRGPPFGGIDLALGSALHAPDPTNLANVVVEGIPATGEERAPIMPGLGAVLTNRQILDLLRYLRARFGASQPWDGIPEAVQAARDTTALLEAAQ